MTFSLPHLGAGLAFSADGRRLAAGVSSPDGETAQVRVWNVADGVEAALLPVPPAGADLIAFSPDGRWLAAGPVLFSAADWRPLFQLPEGHTGDAGSLAALSFGPDPSGALSLLLGTQDGTLLRVDPDPATWLGQACAYVGRELTLAQWQSYLPGRPYRHVCPT
jgi:WD40 repeat protein